MAPSVTRVSLTTTRPDRSAGEDKYVRQKPERKVPPKNTGGLGNVVTVPPPVFAEEKKKQKTAEGLLTSWLELSPAARKQALALISLEAQKPKTGEERDLDLWTGAVYEALVAALGQSDGVAHGPMVVRRVLGAPAFWGPVAEFMEQSGLLGLRPGERLAVYRLLADMVVRRARGMARRADIPLTPKLCATCSQAVAGLFDNAFPGYAAAGLAPMVARRLTQPGNTGG